MLTYSDEKHNVKLKPQHYFPGLSDLSFVGLERTKETIQPLMNNMPLYGQSYTLPLEALEQLKVPVMNLGPM
ncbi:hypothetical protein R0K20_25480, partial [Staphylococcus sp. SIMBA_130]